MKKVKEKDHSDLIFELTAPEGADFVDFKVNRWGYEKERYLVSWFGENDKRKNKCVTLYVKVVGLADKRASMRNWGLFSRLYGCSRLFRKKKEPNG